MTIGLRVYLPPRPEIGASYALRVPRAGSLRTASFRPHLTVAALAVRLMVPAIRVHRGLAPPSQCALPGAQIKRGPRITSGLFHFNPGNDLLSHIVTHAVSSAREGLTAVFGMGTGVSPPP